MLVTVLKEIPEDPDLSEAWNTLVLEMENPEVFFTYQWALAAGRGFRDHLSPLIFLIHESGELIGVVALATNPQSPRRAFFLTSTTADYCDVVSSVKNRRNVVRAILEKAKQIGLSDVVLTNVPASSATLQELPTVAGPQSYYVTSRTAYHCGLVEMEGENQREALLQGLADKSREKRALKRLANLGSVKVIHLSEPEKIGTSLESIVSAQISRFLASDRVSPLVGAERRTFLRHLSDLLSHSGWLKISQLEIDGRPVAWNYGFRFGGSWFWYLPTFEMKYERVSPGSCLLRLLVEEGARDSSVRWLDLGLGDEPYKERFANNLRQTKYVHLSRGIPRHVMSVGRQWLSATASRFPRAGQKLRGARGFCQSATQRLHEVGVKGAVGIAIQKAARRVGFTDEVLFFESESSESAGPDSAQRPELRVLPLSWEHLVEASILHPADQLTLRYLMRSAKRLARQEAAGFILQDGDKPVHFLWVANYEGFQLSEIDHVLAPHRPNAAMIFDCFTPVALRGRGYYAAAVREAAAGLRREGRTPYIFSAAKNISSWKGILNAGFEYRFSLVRRSRFGHSQVTRHETTAVIPPRLMFPIHSDILEKAG